MKIIKPLIILVFCLALFSLDRETYRFTDLFKLQNLVALLLYFIPTYLVCLLIEHLLSRRNVKSSAALSLTIGIPFGFAAVMLVLSLMMGRI